MNLTRRALMLGTAASMSALTLSACGGSDKSASGGSGDGGSGSDSVIRTDGAEPENPLVPTNTSDLGGGNVLAACFACLVHYAKDGTVANDVAESIDSDDKQHWTIKIKKGQTFSDGTPVTAKSFVNAWNFGALTTNAQRAQSFFEPIAGFAEVAAEKPTAKTLTGLKVVDDQTFTVDLVSPQSDFPLRLGYWAFAPLPEVAYKDMKAFGEKPVSNGPYTVKTWKHNTSIDIVRNPKYDGPRKAKNAGISYIVYTDPETAYNDLGNSLDVIGTIPSGTLSTFQDELGDRAINQPNAALMYMRIPAYAEQFAGEAGALRRAAISRAINRPQICEKLFFGTRKPATDFVPPAIKGGGSTDIPGAEVLSFDAAEAKKLWAQAEKIKPFTGDITFAYPADGPNKEWVEAVCNSLTNALGVKASPKPYPAYGEYKQEIGKQAIKSPYRMVWFADYPSPYNFLFPLFSTAAADGKGSNDGNYKSPEFDKLVSEALQAPDEKSALTKYKAAQAVLLKDLPAIPLWYQNTVGGYADGIEGIQFSWNGSLEVDQVTKK